MGGGGGRGVEFMKRQDFPRMPQNRKETIEQQANHFISNLQKVAGCKFLIQHSKHVLSKCVPNGHLSSPHGSHVTGPEHGSVADSRCFHDTVPI
jgi:hypothetical protein